MLNEFSKKEAPIQGLAGMGGGVPSRLLTLASGEVTYVDDVFSTFLWEGNSTNNRAIANGIDLSGDGGLTWIKLRSGSDNHILYDTERGGSKFLSSDLTAAENSNDGLTFNSNGFTIAVNSQAYTNANGSDYCSWTFRKCPGFFDVVTYTGNGTGGLSISHNLGSVPGFIMVKRTSGSDGWFCYHRSLGNTKMVALNGTGAAGTATQYWNDTSPTSTTFTVGTDTAVNANGETYVAYLFAHNDGSFGEDSDEAVIKCGGYTGTGSTGLFVNLGFEPQYVLLKRTDDASNWLILDHMRGVTFGSTDDIILNANQSDNEANCKFNAMEFNPTGFTLDSAGGAVNGSGASYIYIAIRRPHKPPEAATEVFTPVLASSSGDYTATAGFPIDLNFYAKRSGSDKWFLRTRLTGNGYLKPNTTAAIDGSGNTYWDSMTVFKVPGVSGDYSDYINYNFKRAPGFFEIVNYTGNGVQGRNITHNLGVAPELMIVKNKDTTNDDWHTYVSGITHLSVFGSDPDNYGNNPPRLYLNSTTQPNFSASGTWDHTHPTATTFRVGDTGGTNGNGEDLIAFLFASLDGISKIGTYTGTGSAQNIDCGFTNGARFVLIKRVDASAHWIVFDTVRGIVAGNDPYLRISSSAAETTDEDILDPFSAGFSVTSDSTANASGGKYIFFAIA